MMMMMMMRKQELLWEHKPAAECFHNFSKFSNASTSVSIYNLQKKKKRKQLNVYSDHKKVNPPCLHHHCTNRSC